MDLQTELSNLELSVDLLQYVQSHLDFLNEVDKHPTLYSGPVLRQAIFRYEQMWLPLAAEHRNEVLAAPMDIEWVWRCHMLAPEIYKRDCLNTVNCVVNHELFHHKDVQKQCQEFSRKYWYQRYPTESFEMVIRDTGTSMVDLTGDGDDLSLSGSRLEYDLEAASVRQRMFYYQVSLGHYRDETFLKKGLERYKKFLLLKQRNPNVFLVPCYDIDLIWHTHQLFPLVYQQDTTRLLGKILNHDDSVNDRSPGSKLNVSDANTREIWRNTFGEKFSNSGAMFRGDPPHGKLYKMPRDEMFRIAAKKTNIKVDKLEVDGLESCTFTIVERETIVLGKAGPRHDSFKVENKLFTIKLPPVKWNKSRSFDRTLDSLERTHLYVRLTRPKSLMCCSSGTERIGEKKLDLHKLTPKFSRLNEPVRESIKFDFDENLDVNLEMTLTPTKVTHCSLWLDVGSYTECVMPEQIDQLWGPVPLPRLPTGVDNTCSVASHRLKNFQGKATFTCRVIHSLPLLMSAVHVFYMDRMAAVAHLIGSDQLPLPTDVSEGCHCATLNPKKGQRSMLIKNHHGDWAILVGIWQGYRRGKPGKRGINSRPGVPGSPGYLSIHMYKISSKTWSSLTLDEAYLQESFKYAFHGLDVDMKVGKIVLKQSHGEFAEHLALAFSIALLHVMCQPRPKDWEPGLDEVDGVGGDIWRGGRHVRSLEVTDVALIMAAGILVATPSNHLIRKNIRMFPVGSGEGGRGSAEDGYDDAPQDQAPSQPESRLGTFGDSSGGDDAFGDVFGDLDQIELEEGGGDDGGAWGDWGGGWGKGDDGGGDGGGGDDGGGGCGGCGGCGSGGGDGGGDGGGGGGGLFGGAVFSDGGGDGGGGAFDFGGGGDSGGGGWGDGGFGDGGGGDGGGDGGGCGGCGGCGG